MGKKTTIKNVSIIYLILVQILYFWTPRIIYCQNVMHVATEAEKAAMRRAIAQDQIKLQEWIAQIEREQKLPDWFRWTKNMIPAYVKGILDPIGFMVDEEIKSRPDDEGLRIRGQWLKLAFSATSYADVTSVKAAVDVFCKQLFKKASVLTAEGILSNQESQVKKQFAPAATSGGGINLLKLAALGGLGYLAYDAFLKKDDKATSEDVERNVEFICEAFFNSDVWFSVDGSGLGNVSGSASQPVETFTRRLKKGTHTIKAECTYDSPLYSQVGGADVIITVSDLKGTKIQIEAILNCDFTYVGDTISRDFQVK